MEILKVSGKTEVAKLAGAIAGCMREHGSAELQAVGANQHWPLPWRHGSNKARKKAGTLRRESEWKCATNKAYTRNAQVVKLAREYNPPKSPRQLT